MINSVIMLPGIKRFIQTKGGMKSGWCLTAQDNTAVHLCIVRAYLKKRGYIDKILPLLYGDDNFLIGTVQNNLLTTEFYEDIREWYARFNMTIKNVPVSTSLLDNEFLSRYLMPVATKTLGVKHIPWRPTLDSAIRLAYPDTPHVTRPSEGKQAWEDTCARLCGHYIDNYYNSEIRSFCEETLRKICEEHGIQVVRPTHYRRDWYAAGLINIDDDMLNVEQLFKSVPALYGETVLDEIPEVLNFELYNQRYASHATLPLSYDQTSICD
eukprot:CAMPEP_0170507954 /NCGR_PEP_ID=MMETSP0208-20121228/60671_1 /TAXON_ID=197538 /ORGANISM="Strombidium inclinatum, Strain S3" /LENGTH=267 /DNA_ID=CAMNT_0010790515 /DNA_START=1607 /DNA_END=2410 /DNA_ORIENTATION=+